MQIRRILWLESVTDNLASKHRVGVEEAVEVLLSKPVVRRMGRGHVRGEDLFAALGRTRAGRYLIVFFIDKKHGLALPISGRDMEPEERDYYARHQ